MRTRIAVICALSLSAWNVVGATSGDAPPALSAEQSRDAIEIRPGFRVELVAAEPLVQDPVAFDWGPDGRLWVVEMADYPLGLDDKGQPGGRVRFLRDTDGDGKYDESTLFADGLPFPTDVMPWRDGVLVTAAPAVWYLEDTDGDGEADRKEALFRGFGEGNQQHRVNGLRWGLDNWVYLANGDSGGKIRSAKTGQTVDINGRDLRVQPDSGSLDAVTGHSQHGRGRDDWGNWWGANNSAPMYQFVLDDRYLRRNPHVAPPDPRVNVATLEDTPLYPISRVISHWSGYKPPQPGQPSRFTSACSTMTYRDTLLGDDLTDNMFVSEPVHNLVHRRIIEWDGVTMRSGKPADEEGREFLRSRDSWFRPTTLRTGPDGCLWVADMYRLVIEHPEWIDDTVEKSLDLRVGHDKGRIYRVVRQGTKPRPVPDFGAMTVRQLVDSLASPNGWTRDMAHRLLLWRNDHAARALLESAVRTGDDPRQRLHALCVLDGMAAVSPELVIAAMNDPHPGVRRHAVRIAERFATETNEPVIAAIVTLSGKERDPHAVMQIAYSLGEFDDAAAGRALGSLLARHAGDTHLSAAAISGIGKRTADVLAGLRDAHTGAAPIAPVIRTAFGKGDVPTTRAAVGELLTTTDGEFAPWQFAALAEIGRSLRGQSLDDLMTSDRAREQLAAMRAAARRAARDAESPVASRTVALRLIGHDPAFASEDAGVFVSLLATGTPPELRQAALDAVADLPDDTLAKSVLTRWNTFDQPTRDSLVGVLLHREGTTRAMFAAIKSGSVDPSDVNPTHRRQLATHRDREIAESATELFGTGATVERQELIDRYLPTVKASGDADRGLTLFRKTCAQCHQLAGHGHAVGPDLAGLLDKSPEFLTTHVLDPDRAVEDKYRNYTAFTVDGRQFTGLLQNETATSVTLVELNGVSHTILKRDLEPDGLARGQNSMMPGGLEQTLDPRSLADVVAFIAANQERPKSFDGNRPRLAEAEREGNALRLRAADAEVYGETLVFEARYGNLGYWSSANDRAVWTVNVPVAGRYDVYLDWAAAVDVAGDPYLLRAGGETIRGRVESTGTWDDYRQAKVGTLRLTPGRQRMAFLSDGEPRRSLIDLREICLVPEGERPPGRFRGKD